MNITFQTDYEKKIYNERTHFVAVRRIAGIKTRAEFKSLDEAHEYGISFGDKRTMIYAVNDMGLSAHIINF